ncbi:hypothetical protein F4778DRAFT_765273 [Xylariomycetidae sp. FL2044]|nr:hypothetical protein F4778DRAFT_765273 [Xylariomycetidae sp. FL2044]
MNRLHHSSSSPAASSPSGLRSDYGAAGSTTSQLGGIAQPAIVQQQPIVNQQNPASQQPTISHRRRQRVTKACDNCHLKHLTCSGLRSCRQCVSLGIECTSHIMVVLRNCITHGQQSERKQMHYD